MAKQERPHKIALAKGHEYRPERIPKGRKFLYVENKKDGIRCVVIDGKCYTSTGVRIINAPMIEKAFAAIPNIGKKFVFDGELYYKNCDTTKAIAKTLTKEHPLRDKLQLFLFDCIHRSEWDNQKGKTALKRRKVNLFIAVKKIRVKSKHPVAKKAIQLFEHFTIEPTNQAVKKFQKKSVADGHEGSMIKDPESVYAFRKNWDWQKLKPYRESDLKIIGAELGTKGKQHENRLGKLILSGVVDGVKVKTKCGGGLTHKNRDELWKLYQKGKLVGKIAEIKHEGLTKNNAVRFPEFLRLHPDKNS